MVRVRDLPLAGRITYLRWRKRRFGCGGGCGRTFTETHPALPSRQRVSVRFGRHLFARCEGGGALAEIARDEQTSCYPVQTAFRVAGDELLARRETGRHGACRLTKRTTVAAGSSRPSSLISIAVA